MRYFITVGLILFYGVILLTPDVVLAQAGGGTSGGLVTCTGLDCDFCKLVEMIEKVIDFLVTLLIIIATIMLAITGLQMAYTAAGGSDAREILKERMTNIIIGFVLIIASWTLVDTLLKALVTDDLKNNWRTPASELCGRQAVPNEPVINADGAFEDRPVDVAAGSASYQSGTVSGDVTVNQNMNPIFDPDDGGSHMVKPGAAERMQETLDIFKRVEDEFGRPLVINDAIAKAGTSRETETPGSRHFHGDALDVSLAGMSDADKIRLYQIARRNGFTGFGFGNNILHMDRRPSPMAWSYGNTTFGGRSVGSLRNEVISGRIP